VLVQGGGRQAESLVKTTGPLSDRSTNLNRGGWGIKAQYTCPLTADAQIRIATMAKKRFFGVIGLRVDRKTFSPFADNALICPQVGTELFT
jgi:hypothetical protein